MLPVRYMSGYMTVELTESTASDFVHLRKKLQANSENCVHTGNKSNLELKQKSRS